MVIKTTHLIAILLTLIIGMMITVNWEELKQYFKYLYDTFFRGK